MNSSWWKRHSTLSHQKSLVELKKMLFIRSKVTLHLLNSTRVLMSLSKHSSYFCRPHRTWSAFDCNLCLFYSFYWVFFSHISKNNFFCCRFFSILELSSNLRLDIYKGMKIESISIIFWRHPTSCKRQKMLRRWNKNRKEK